MKEKTGKNQTIEVPTDPDRDLIELAGRVYEGLSNQEVDEVEKLAKDRSNFFE